MDNYFVASLTQNQIIKSAFKILNTIFWKYNQYFNSFRSPTIDLWIQSMGECVSVGRYDFFIFTTSNFFIWLFLLEEVIWQYNFALLGPVGRTCGLGYRVDLIFWQSIHHDPTNPLKLNQTSQLNPSLLVLLQFKKSKP